MIEERDIKRLNWDLIDLERLNYVILVLFDVIVKDYKEFVGEGDWIDKGEEVEELEEMEDEEEIEDLVDCVLLVLFFLKF